MIEKKLSPGEYLYQKEHNNNSLYLLVEGQVDIYQNDKKIYSLKSGCVG